MVPNSGRAILVLLAIFCCTLCAQQSSKAHVGDVAVVLPEFEVASVKPTDVSGDILVDLRIYPGGRVMVRGCELSGLIRVAFGLSYQQISGGPDWIRQIKYEVEALPSKDSGIKDWRYAAWKVADEHLREMLQALLISRFQLKFHRETRTGDVYLLKQSAKPPAFHPTSVDPSSLRTRLGSVRWLGLRQWVLDAATMADVADYAVSVLGGIPVFDRTGLSGPFDYKQNQTEVYKPNRTDMTQAERDSEFQSALSSSFLNLLQELHLKLERAKGPVETFVIDRAEKPLPN